MNKTFVLLSTFLCAALLIASSVSAYNGDGVIEDYSPLAVTVGSNNDLNFVFYNDATDNTCIDEIIITAPATWSGTASVTEYTRGGIGAITVYNEADAGDYIGLTADLRSVRIVPDSPLCSGERVEITVAGLVAPTFSEDAVFQILTSDQYNNDPTSQSRLRYDIDVFPVIRVTRARDLKIEYLHIEGFTSAGFQGRGTGAKGRLESLMVFGDVAGTVDVYMESGLTAGFQPGEDIDLGTFPITGGGTVDTLSMVYPSPWPGQPEIYNGYVPDGQVWNYYLEGYAGTLFMRGHTDSPKDPTPPNSMTGLSGARGTIIDVDHPSTGRVVNVQLIDQNGWDVNDDKVPIFYTTDLGHYVETGQPQYTDSDGNRYLTLMPDCEKGVAELVLSSLTLSGVNSINEYVGINSGTPVSFAVTQGDGAEIVGGDNQLIEVTLYDACGNVITDSPLKPNVDFDLLTTCGGKLANDPSVAPASDFHHDEKTNMGIADVYLVTGCDLCTHEVEITVEGLGSQTIYLDGIVGDPYKIVVTPFTTPDGKMLADECIDVLVEVTDQCGNRIVEYEDPISGHIQQWESIVRVEIVSPLSSPEGSTHITWTDFREESFLESYIVQGKLTDGAGNLEICGCQGLGQFDIIANTDTLLPGEAEVDVENAPPLCIDVDTCDDELLVCEDNTNVEVSVIDECGNKLIDQECGSGGSAFFCVDLMIQGTGSNPCGPEDAHLSTDSVCADLVNTGEAPDATLYRDTENCCELEVVATDAEDCCPVFDEPLPQCDPLEFRFVGYPDYVLTEFESVNPANQYLVDGGEQIVSEEVKDVFSVYDTCGFLVNDFSGHVDVELEGEDCASFIEVQSPLTLDEGYCTGEIPCSVLTDFGEEKCLEAQCDWTGGECVGQVGICNDFTKEQCTEPVIDIFCDWYMDEMCEFGEYAVLDKVVIDNCAEPGKQWTDLEEEDIMVDKMAFKTELLPDPPGLAVYIYKETETQAGFQISGTNADVLVGRAPWTPGEIIVELVDAPFMAGLDHTWYSRGWGFDDQREGGVLIRAGDTTDFYVVLQSHPTPGIPMAIPCGTYGAAFNYYQDYNSPDLTELGMPGDVRDHCVNDDNYNWISTFPHPAPSSLCGTGFMDSRNDDYIAPSTPHYPGATPDYGFGDRVARDVAFINGKAYVVFRDLTAEHVNVWLSDLYQAGSVCYYEEMEDLEIGITPQPEEIDFLSQPATQVVLINHDGFYPKTVTCNGEFDPEENAFLLNLQTADGFQNPHGKEIEVQLEYCLKLPFGDRFIDQAVTQYCIMHPDHPICDKSYMDRDHCFTREELRDLLRDTSVFGSYLEEVFFGDYFGEELTEWLDSYFENAKVDFYDSARNPLPIGADGNAVVWTDVNGQAQIYVTSAYAGLFKVIARPYALDADYTFVSFTADVPAQLDIVSLPSFGVPADGEEEAMLLLRVLDVCGNVVYKDIDYVTVTASGEQVYISEDFEGNNNYDESVTGELVYDSMVGETDLRVLSDLPQTSTITASASGLVSDSTEIVFQGAPRKLVITEISPSDRLPADSQTGAWVTVEVQDKHGERVTGYLGNGFSGDPGDPWGFTDYTFENICVEISPMGFVPMGTSMPFLDTTKFGWKNFHVLPPGGPTMPTIYCGDLMFGRGSFYVVYNGIGCNHGGTLTVDVFDWTPFQGQEMNENGIPSSKVPTQLDPAHGEIDFVDPATQWNIWSDKLIVPADGSSKATVSIQVENPYMDIRQAVEGNVYVGGTAENGAVLNWNGHVDPHNPTSARIVTDPITGRTTLELTSTTPGTAEITITGGQAYVCMNRMSMGFQCPQCEEVFHQYMCHYNQFVDLEPMTITVDFLEVADNEVYLETGWNFISVPYELASGYDTVADIFDLSKVSTIYGWDASAQAFDPLTGTDTLEPLYGYWVKMLEPDMVTFTYEEPSFPSIPQKTVYQGWETVGLTWNSPTLVKNALISIDNSYSQFIGWDAVNQKYELPVANTGGNSPLETGGANMVPKMGYWVWVTAQDTLAGLTAKG